MRLQTQSQLTGKRSFVCRLWSVVCWAARYASLIDLSILDENVDSDYNDQPRVEISKRLVIINSVSSILTMAIEVFFNFWLYQYLIRRITPEEYSLLPVVMSIMVFFPLLTVFFTAGIGRYIIEAYAKGDEEGVTRIISSIFPFLMLCTILVLGIGGLTALNVDHILNIPEGRLSDARLMFSLLFITFAYRISALPFQFGFQVKQKFVASNLLTLAQTLTKIAILFVLLFSSGVWVVWVVVANTATGVVFITVRLIYSRRILPSLKYRVRMFDFSTAKTSPVFWILELFRSICKQPLAGNGSHYFELVCHTNGRDLLSYRIFFQAPRH